MKNIERNIEYYVANNLREDVWYSGCNNVVHNIRFRVGVNIRDNIRENVQWNVGRNIIRNLKLER